MHLPDGILSSEMLILTNTLAVGAVAIGVRQMREEEVPRAGVMAAAFFVVSLIHVPVPPASVHLMMSGLVGMVLGWGAFPAIAVGLLFQMIMFRFGGITVLGANTLIMGAPAVLGWVLIRPFRVNPQRFVLMTVGAMLGGGSILLSCLLFYLLCMFSGEAFEMGARGLVLIHIPVMVIEALVTAFAVGFLFKVKPALLAGLNFKKQLAEATSYTKHTKDNQTN